jgi:hypothetical protein
MYVCIHACMYVRIKNHISIHITYNQATYDAATYVSKYVSMYVCIHASFITSHRVTFRCSIFNSTKQYIFITSHYVRSATLDSHRSLSVDTSCWSVTISYYQENIYHITLRTISNARFPSLTIGWYQLLVSYYQLLPVTTIRYQLPLHPRRALRDAPRQLLSVTSALHHYPLLAVTVAQLGGHFAMHHVSYYPLHQLCTTIRY